MASVLQAWPLPCLPLSITKLSQQGGSHPDQRWHVPWAGQVTSALRGTFTWNDHSSAKFVSDREGPNEPLIKTPHLVG